MVFDEYIYSYFQRTAPWNGKTGTGTIKLGCMDN